MSVKNQNTKGKQTLPGTFNGSLGGLDLYSNGVTARQWDAWLNSVPISSIEQTWSYGEAFVGVTPYTPVHSVVYKKKLPVAMVQMVEWKIANAIRLIKIVRGPLFFKNVSLEDKSSTYALINKQYSWKNFDFLIWTPECIDSSQELNLFKILGRKKVVTGYSSILLDLSKSEEQLEKEMHSKWRNQLKKAKQQKLNIQLGYGGAALEWLLTRHEGNRRRKRLRMPASPFILAISLAMRNKQSTLAFSAYKGREAVSGILVFRHGNTATYYLSWNGTQGRMLNANNLLLWHAIKELKSRGVRWFDLGGVDGSSMPGVSRFKLGVGGELFTLAGTFV